MNSLYLVSRHLGHHSPIDLDSDYDMDGMSSDNPLIVNEEMNVGTIDVLWFPRLYWVFVGAFIAAVAMVNLFDYLIYRQRISAARRKEPTPARPKNILLKSYATLTAVFREASNASLPSFRIKNVALRQPTVGALAMVLGNLVLLLVLCFYALEPRQYLSFQNIGYRTGYVSMAQLPLIFLLSGKNNVIGWLTGCSYERLNWLHRWSARTLLVTVTLHGGYWFGNWAPYHYGGTMATTDPVTIRGIAAWAILVWIIFSSFAPIRGWSYEIFVLQHAVSYIAFITMIFLHTPTEDHGWLWAPVIIYFSDRVVRACYAVYINLAIFHPRQKKQGNFSGLWACKAELEPLPDNMTRVTIRNPPITWKAGQHAFFSSHSVVPLQSHPFTISSIPEDGKLEFLVKAHKGGTRRLFDYAQKQIGLPTIQDATTSATVAVAIEGPYGHIRPVRQFDSVVFFAGSIGATFTVPLLRDIVRQWKEEPSTSKGGILNSLQAPDGAVTRHIRFVWVVKSRSQIKWFATQLNRVIEDVQNLRKLGQDVEVDMSIYVTCDETFTEDWNASILPSGPAEPTSIAEKQLQPSPPYSSEKPTTSFPEKDGLSKQSDPSSPQAIHVLEIDPRLDSTTSSTSTNPTKTCQPDGTCCCQTTITDESSPTSAVAEAIICHCACSHNPTTSTSSSTLTPPSTPPPQPLLAPSIILLAGRPHPRTIIRRALEQARGESAVVVCGPKGLNGDVRASVVALSDERAVHKGTGAQGVWFYGEGFGL